MAGGVEGDRLAGLIAEAGTGDELGTDDLGLGHGSGQRPNPPVPPSRRGKGGTPTENQVRLPLSVSERGLGGEVRWPGL
jgi:hypothetical protein